MDMKYNCDMIQDLIPLCIDGAASKPSEKAVTEHLADCMKCQNYYEQINKSTEVYDPGEAINVERLQYKELAKKLVIYRFLRRILIAAFCMIVVMSALYYGDGYRMTSLAATKTSKWVNQDSKLVADYNWGDWHFFFYENVSMYNSVITNKRNFLWKEQNNNFWLEKTGDGLNLAGWINFYTDFKGGIIILPIQNKTSETLDVEISFGNQKIRKKIKADETELFVHEFKEASEDNETSGYAFSIDGRLLYTLKSRWNTISGQMEHYWESTN